MSATGMIENPENGDAHGVSSTANTARRYDLLGFYDSLCASAVVVSIALIDEWRREASVELLWKVVGGCLGSVFLVASWVILRVPLGAEGFPLSWLGAKRHALCWLFLMCGFFMPIVAASNGTAHVLLLAFSCIPVFLCLKTFDSPSDGVVDRVVRKASRDVLAVGMASLSLALSAGAVEGVLLWQESGADPVVQSAIKLLPVIGVLIVGFYVRKRFLSCEEEP